MTDKTDETLPARMLTCAARITQLLEGNEPDEPGELVEVDVFLARDAADLLTRGAQALQVAPAPPTRGVDNPFQGEPPRLDLPVGWYDPGPAALQASRKSGNACPA